MILSCRRSMKYFLHTGHFSFHRSLLSEKEVGAGPTIVFFFFFKELYYTYRIGTYRSFTDYTQMGEVGIFLAIFYCPWVPCGIDLMNLFCRSSSVHMILLFFVRGDPNRWGLWTVLGSLQFVLISFCSACHKQVLIGKFYRVGTDLTWPKINIGASKRLEKREPNKKKWN